MEAQSQDLQALAQEHQIQMLVNSLLGAAAMENLELLFRGRSKVKAFLSNIHPMNSIFSPATLGIMELLVTLLE